MTIIVPTSASAASKSETGSAGGANLRMATFGTRAAGLPRGSIHGGVGSCFRSDGLMSKCQSAFECSAWNLTAGSWRVMRSWS